MDATSSVAFGATVFTWLLGLVALVGGLYTYLHAKYLERRCTQQTPGTITAILDEGFKKKRAPSPDDEHVVAANEQIAAKQRAYKAKKRSEAQAAADATLSTWRPVVSYLVDGTPFEGRAVRGVTQKRFKVGEKTTVFYDPSRPGKTRWFAIDGLPTGMGITLMICGAALIGIGVACWFVLPELATMSNEVFAPTA